jgi:hypothetical protein
VNTCVPEVETVLYSHLARRARDRVQSMSITTAVLS